MIQELHPFEHTPLSRKFAINAEWHIKDGILHVRSQLTGPVNSLEYEQSESPSARDELWKQTCFEVFLLESNATRYVEWNCSPGGDFQRYHFTAYREQNAVAPAPSVAEVQVSWTKSSESLQAHFAAPLPFAEPQKIQICWVLKTRGGETMYWAISHTSSKPDFHNVDAFYQCGA